MGAFLLTQLSSITKTIYCVPVIICTHVHDYVSIHIIIRSKFRYGTRGVGFVFKWSCWNGIKCIKFGDNKVQYFIFLTRGP